MTPSPVQVAWCCVSWAYAAGVPRTNGVPDSRICWPPRMPYDRVLLTWAKIGLGSAEVNDNLQIKKSIRL